MKSLQSKLNLPEVLVNQLREELTSSLPGNQVEPTLNHWLTLVTQKRFHAPIARKTLNLRQDYVDTLNHKEIGAILEEEHFSIESAKVYRSEQYCVIHLMRMLGTIFDYVQAGKTISEPVIRDLAYMLLDEYPWMTFPDVRLCLRRGIQGKYGEIYDRLDVPVIFGWFRSYVSERVAESESRKRQKDREEVDKGVPMPEEIKAKFEELEKKLKEQEEQNKTFEPSLSKQLNHLRT